MSFGQFLREERKKHGLSQRVLAQLIGTSNTEISRIEQEIRQKPSPVMLKKLSEVLDIPLDIIMREAGYTPHSSVVVQKLQSEKVIFEIITPYVEKSGYHISNDYMSSLGNYPFPWDFVAEQKDASRWVIDFIYLLDEQKTTNNPIQINKLIRGLGIAAIDKNISKLSFVFNNETLFNNCRKLFPERLTLEVSLLLVDTEQKLVLQEAYISK